MQSSRKDLVEFDPDSLSFGEDLNENSVDLQRSKEEPEAEFTHNEIKDAHWFYDTPGIIKDCDVSRITCGVQLMSTFCVKIPNFKLFYSLRFLAC